MNNIKNVLSIDLDYILEPCIQLYNDLSLGDIKNKVEFWNFINQVRDIDKYLEYNENNLKFIFNIITKNISKVKDENIYFAKDHDAILTFLCTDENKENKFNIFNIDHHHDIYYHKEHKECIDRFDFTCLADWVYYLGKQEMINKYFWIGNKNSEEFKYKNDINFPFSFFSEPKNSNIYDVQFDYIFVCFSPGWVPPKFYYFFEIILQMVENIKNKKYTIDTNLYCVNEKSHPYKIH